MSVSLRAVADDSYRLAAELLKIAVLLIENSCHFVYLFLLFDFGLMRNLKIYYLTNGRAALFKRHAAGTADLEDRIIAENVDKIVYSSRAVGQAEGNIILGIINGNGSESICRTLNVVARLKFILHLNEQQLAADRVILAEFLYRANIG